MTASLPYGQRRVNRHFLKKLKRKFFIGKAGVAELADALDSKSSGREAVWVRAPPPALLIQDSLFPRRIASPIATERFSRPREEKHLRGTESSGMLMRVWKREGHKFRS
jgi:hypothetical protein